MPFSTSVHDRERDKFVETSDNETAIRVTLEARPGATPITVENSVPALQGNMRTTTLEVTDAPTPLPPLAFPERRAISIFNKSLNDTIYIGSNNMVTANSVVGTTSGWEIGPLETFNTDVLDQNSIYAIAEAGKTILVKILEVK